MNDSTRSKSSMLELKIFIFQFRILTTTQNNVFKKGLKNCEFVSISFQIETCHILDTQYMFYVHSLQWKEYSERDLVIIAWFTSVPSKIFFEYYSVLMVEMFSGHLWSSWWQHGCGGHGLWSVQFVRCSWYWQWCSRHQWPDGWQHS